MPVTFSLAKRIMSSWSLSCDILSFSVYTKISKSKNEFVCLIDFFELHEQFLSYLVAVIITGDRAANLDLCLAFTAFSSECY
jgi:hypothetical protein